MVKNIKLKRKAKKLKRLRIIWYLIIDTQAKMLHYSYILSKQSISGMPDNVRKHIIDVYENNYGIYLKSKNRLRKQIIKCKTK